VDAEPLPLDDLAAHAHDTHVVVIGGGIGGLVAALTCAKVGIRVTVLEESGRLGGAIRTTEIGGVRADLGAEGYATRGGAVRALVDELGLTEAVVPTAPRAEWIGGLPGGPVSFPEATVRGIPENPWEESVRRVIGRSGTWRAYLDRLRPPLTIGQERSLGRLVRTRMGDLVLDRLVAPLSLGGFSIHPDDVDVELVAPGLNAALTRTGSLAGAVMQLRADHGPRPAGDGLEGIAGGMSRIVDALHERLRLLGADVRLDSRVDALERRADGRWQAIVTGEPGEAAAEEDAGIDVADAMILATGARDAHRLLAGFVPAFEQAPVTDLEVVTLVVESPELAAAPVRTAVYPIAGTAVAASVTDSTARWPWMRGAHTRVLKVTFGGPGVPPATAALDDQAAAALALAEASSLLSVPLAPAALRGSQRSRWAQPPPASALGRRERAEAARAAIHEIPGLAVAGAWIAGTGLAQVVPDAIAEAERVRRQALWGSADERP
jgi:oxygen-dependent protoporphyrinogen oxidase